MLEKTEHAGKLYPAEKALTIGESLKAWNLFSTIKQKRWIRRRAQLEHNIQHFAERETYFSEELPPLQKLQTSHRWTRSRDSKINSYQKKLEKAKKNYWTSTRDLHRHLQKTLKGTYIQRYNLEQKEKHEELVERAKDRCKYEGGCCAFGCGCCSRPRKTLRDRELIDSVFHCTSNCRCCVQRGCPAEKNPRKIQVIRV